MFAVSDSNIKKLMQQYCYAHLTLMFHAMMSGNFERSPRKLPVWLLINDQNNFYSQIKFQNLIEIKYEFLTKLPCSK